MSKEELYGMITHLWKVIKPYTEPPKGNKWGEIVRATNKACESYPRESLEQKLFCGWCLEYIRYLKGVKDTQVDGAEVNPYQE